MAEVLSAKGLKNYRAWCLSITERKLRYLGFRLWACKVSGSQGLISRTELDGFAPPKKVDGLAGFVVGSLLNECGYGLHPQRRLLDRLGYPPTATNKRER